MLTRERGKNVGGKVCGIGHLKGTIRNEFKKNLKQIKRVVLKVHSWEQSFIHHPPWELRAVCGSFKKQDGRPSLPQGRAPKSWHCGDPVPGVQFTCNVEPGVQSGGNKLMSSVVGKQFSGEAACKVFCQFPAKGHPARSQPGVQLLEWPLEEWTGTKEHK